MAVAMTVALPMWRTAAQREKEAELIFRGEQYAHAIALFQRKYANTFPPNIDILVEQRFLRKKYNDPMTKDGEFQVLYAAQPQAQGTQQTAQPAAGRGGQQPAQPALQPSPATGPGGATGARGGIMGIASKSTDTSLRLYNGHNKYNEWTFVATQATLAAGAPTGGPAGRQGGQGRGNGPGGGPQGGPQLPGGRSVPGPPQPGGPQLPGGRGPFREPGAGVQGGQQQFPQFPGGQQPRR
jgi:hypothetical protein